jgi:hypothetical protein
MTLIKALQKNKTQIQNMVDNIDFDLLFSNQYNSYRFMGLLITIRIYNTPLIQLKYKNRENLIYTLEIEFSNLKTQKNYYFSNLKTCVPIKNKL